MTAKPTRLRFESVEKIEDEKSGRFDIAVQLSYGEKTYRGVCYGYIGESDELELAASAALQAVSEFVEHHFECQTLELDRVSALGKELIVLLINVRFDERELQIFGSSLAVGDLLEASARAALDATNRFVDLTLESGRGSAKIPSSSDFA